MQLRAGRGRVTIGQRPWSPGSRKGLVEVEDHGLTETPVAVSCLVLEQRRHIVGLSQAWSLRGEVAEGQWDRGAEVLTRQ